MKILVVEDEPKVPAFFRKRLKPYEVEVAYDGYYGTQLALRALVVAAPTEWRASLVVAIAA